MPLPSRIDAVFCDVGGPIYSDENFANAARRGVDELRAEQGRSPADPATTRATSVAKATR